MMKRANLVAAFQCPPHLLLSHAEGKKIMVLVMALYQACGAEQSHVIGAKILKQTQVAGTALHPHLIKRLHHGVCPEGLPLKVSLKMPGTQGHLALETGLHSRRPLIHALVTENLHRLLLRDGKPEKMWCGGTVTLNDAGEFEVFLQGFHTLIFLATFWAAWKRFAALVSSVRCLADAGSTVVVPTGEDHRIRVELKADRAAQLMSKHLLRLGPGHDGGVKVKVFFCLVCSSSSESRQRENEGR